ncbi:MULTISPECIES: prevent-host-death protein [unclassified Polynucleobacter]|uniref:prevent-host-death protein n=1 Tax=unclassified Polynucleobacter TaxID=2640945 RepID=UPI00248FFA5A|nr:MULTISPECIES: prevent-host-death protein [unclassified Polynucleobacter]
MKHKRFKKKASTHLHEWIDHCIAKGPQMIIRSSLPKATLVPFEHWQKLLNTQQPSLKELLLSDDNRGELVIPKRGRCRTRRNIHFI